MLTNQNGNPRHTEAAITAGIAVERWPSQSTTSGQMPVSVAMLPVLAILVFAGTAMMQRGEDD